MALTNTEFDHDAVIAAARAIFQNTGIDVLPTKRRRPANDELGSPLSAEEIDFAARRMPVCTCPALMTLDGRRHVTHRPGCYYEAVSGA